jgi:hypothetical protein
MVYDFIRKRLEAMDYRNPPYSTRYPEILAIEKYYRSDGGVPPEGSIVARNVSVGGKWLSVGWHAKMEMLKLENNLVDVDPLFVDRA